MTETTQSSKIRILLIDDHTLFRESLARLLADEPDFEIVGVCGSIDEATAVLSDKSADVVLLDLDLGGDRGTTFFDRARAQGFKARIVIVAGVVRSWEAVDLIQRGAGGIFLKQNHPSLLAKCIRKVVTGDVWLGQEHLQALLHALGPPRSEVRKPQFSDRERQVLDAVLEGLGNKEIAQSLQISESSVKSALQQLFNKTGVRTRSQLVRIALEQYRTT